MRIRHPSRRGAVMSPARRSTGATCWGRPRHRRPVALKCRRRTGRERRGTARLWARAHVGRLPLPEWASGRPAPVWHPAGRALPGHRDLHLAKPILREGRRSDWCPSARSMTVRTTRTPTPCKGAVAREVVGFGVDAERCPVALTVVAYPGWRGPGYSCAPYRKWGPWAKPGRCGGQRNIP
jgi:hypothetical protein